VQLASAQQGGVGVAENLVAEPYTENGGEDAEGRTIGRLQEGGGRGQGDISHMRKFGEAAGGGRAGLENVPG
jgi:hypothetical protein